MKKLFFIWVALCLFFSQVIAQANLPPVYEIRSDTTLKIFLPNVYWQLLEDKDGELKFEQVSNSSLSNKFHYDTAGKINFQISTYWFRYTFKNSTNHQLKIGFYDDFKSTSDWYIIYANKKIIHKTSGLQTPWSKNESLKFINYFSTSVNFLPITIEPQETVTFYNRAYYNYFSYSHINPRQFYIAYGSAEKVILQNYVSDESHYLNSINDSFLFGVLVLAAVFNFFFFLIVREKTYIFFALYVFFLGLGRFNIESEFFLVFLREHPVFYSYFLDFHWVFTEFFLVYFIRSLLNVKKYYPQWDKFIFYFNLLNAVLFLLYGFIDYALRGINMWGIGDLISTIAYSLLRVALLVTIFLFLKQNIFFDKRFLIAILPSFIIWVVGVTVFNLINPHFVHVANFDSWIINNWHSIETFCLVWQVLCFSSLLFHRFVELKQQVIQKQLEQSKLIVQKTELELQALRAQMNPHFIFNCLNSINRFIIKNDATKAADYLTKFAKLIRIVLEQSGKSFVSLEDELSCLKLYMDLEALRFEIPFQYKIDLNGTDVTTVMIPTMLIQPFVENAIWHGLHPKQNGVGEININIYQNDGTLHCSICDNGVGIKNLKEISQVNKKSLGIELTQQRLQLIGSNQHEHLKIKTEQLKNADGQVSGTCVHINIPFKND